MSMDNKTANKMEYAEMVRSSISPHVINEAASHTFEKRRSPVSTWAAVACFALIFAAAASFLFKPKTERGQAASGTPSPDNTKTVQATPERSPEQTPDNTPAPTPDIRNMPIIYGRADCIGIDDVQHRAGTVTLYGGLNEMLADEQYASCVFAVDIDIQDRYLENMYSNFYSEEFDKLYKEFQNDPAVVRYNELYEGFVQENSERYYELLEEYFYPSEFHGDFQTREEELEAIAEKYDESMVFSVAFGYYLESTGQEQILSDYAVAQDEYNKMRSELFKEQESNPVDAELKSRHEAEVQRLKDCGLISEIYEFGGETMLYWLLTRDQLLSFPASPEFAYVITPALDPEAAPEPTETPDGIAVDEAQVEHIINLLAEYHAAQFSRSAEIGELKLSENVLSELEQRQRCIDETEERIGQLNYASATVNRLYIAPYYEINGDFKCFTVLYYELVNRNYCSDLQYDFLIRHTVTVAPDGTVLSDIFSEKNTTGFSNTPLGGETLEYYPITSDHYDYLAAANALLAGEAPERTDFYCGQQYVFFSFTDDGLMAYDVAYVNDDYEFLFDEPIAVFPREVSELAYRRLNEYYDRYVGDSDHDVGPEPMYQGFVGENWFTLVTLDDSTKDLQAHCIFYFDGNEWREIIASPGLYTDSTDERIPYTIFGACVLGEDNAIICYYSEWIFRAHAQDNNLHIYRTENGGENWSRLDIVLPDHYTDMLFYAPLTPVFDESGINGVIVLQSYLGNGLPAPFAWLESHDGGYAWEFHSAGGNN